MFNHQQRRKLELHLLGAPEIRLAGKPLSGLPTKTQALLFYLAMTGQAHLRTALANLLWGELPEQNGRANLRKAIQQLRTTLPEHFHSDRQAIALQNEPLIWVDAAAFAEQIGQTQHTNDPQALEDAIRLYRDDFLAGFFVRNAPDLRPGSWRTARVCASRCWVH